MSTGYGRRIKQAILQYQADALAGGGDEPNFNTIGAKIAEVEGRRTPYVSQTLSSWVTERRQPSLEAFEAMATVFSHKSAGWLAFALVHELAHMSIPEPPPPVLPLTDVTTKRQPTAKRRRRRNGSR